MLGLTLDWWRCPDGFGLVDRGEPRPRSRLSDTIYADAGPGLWFRAKSDRRESYRRDSIDLEDTLALPFINADSESALLDFFGAYGSLHGSDKEAPKRVAKKQADLTALLEKAASGDPSLAGPAVAAMLHDIGLRATFDHLGNGQTARLALRARNLWEFMVMEVAVAAAKGARLQRCDHCRTAFITGAATARRSHAKFCSAKCRVAAMRERNAAKGEAP